MKTTYRIKNKKKCRIGPALLLSVLTNVLISLKLTQCLLIQPNVATPDFSTQVLNRIDRQRSCRWLKPGGPPLEPQSFLQTKKIINEKSTKAHWRFNDVWNNFQQFLLVLFILIAIKDALLLFYFSSRLLVIKKGNDGIPAHSTGFRYKPKDLNTYSSLWIEKRHKRPNL